MLPPFSNIKHSEIQNLSTNINHPGLRVNPIILIVHCFLIFSNIKTCMQSCREGACGGGVWKMACYFNYQHIFSYSDRVAMLNSQGFESLFYIAIICPKNSKTSYIWRRREYLTSIQLAAQLDVYYVHRSVCAVGYVKDDS